MNLAREIVRFLRMHWAHLLIAPGMALVVTLLHESAHCAAVLLQGGTVTEFSWLPTTGHWGFMGYEFAANQEYSSFAISFAPYGVWLTVATMTFALGLTCRGLPFWIASALFVWGYVVPLGDIANAAWPYLLGHENDFRRAFGPPLPVMWLSTAFATGVAVVLGFPLQRRLYGERGVSATAYCVLTGVCLAAAAVLSGVV